MPAEASTPTTAPWGTRAAISAVVLPLPQPISRIRSRAFKIQQRKDFFGHGRLKRGNPRVFGGVPFGHTPAFWITRQVKGNSTNRETALYADRGYIGGKYEPLGIAGDVFQANDFFPDEQVVVTQGYVLADFSINRVNDGFLSQERAVGIRCFHELVADFVTYISDRSTLARRHQSSFSVS